jgi:RNA polymerase sigma-70 factor (ECF subfamily)
MDQKTDADIVAMVLNGDRQAYALLVQEYKNPVYNLAYRMTGNPEDAEDIAQEAFLSSFRQLSRYDSRRSFFTWLYTISLNIIRNHLKKTGRWLSDSRTMLSTAAVVSDTEKAAFHGVVNPDESRKELEDQLESCLAKLSPDLRELIVLRFYQGLSFEAIADITGFSQGALKMRVYRGLEKLKEIMQKNVTSSR